MRLMVDDLRAPPSKHWEIARSAAAAQYYFTHIGVPAFLSLDHDLGDGVPTGYDLCMWLVDQILDGKINPTNFRRIHVHSANPIGAENMRSLLYNLFKHLKESGIMVNIPEITSDLSCNSSKN